MSYPALKDLANTQFILTINGQKLLSKSEPKNTLKNLDHRNPPKDIPNKLGQHNLPAIYQAPARLDGIQF